MAATKPEQATNTTTEASLKTRRKAEIVRKLVEEWHDQSVTITPAWRKAIETAKRMNSETTQG